MPDPARLFIPALIAALVCTTACSKKTPPVGGPQSLREVAAPGSAEPNLSALDNGGVLMSWLEPDADGVALKFSTLLGNNWSEPNTVARGDDWFVNWADFPSVVSVDGALWAAHWLRKRPGGTYAYDVNVSVSADGGQTWSAPITPHNDGTATEHGFVSLFPWQDGVGVLWLDGRNMDPGTAHEQSSGGMTLRSAVLDETGTIIDEQIADDLVCDCCQTDVAIWGSAPVAVYRDRSPDEVRDIYAATAREGQWQPGSAVASDGWTIAGCPVNGPAISSAKQHMGVAWFTGANNEPRVRFARITGDIMSVSPAIDVSTQRPAGRVGVIALENGGSLVSWLRTLPDGNAEICIRSVSADRQLGDVHVIATTSAGRMSGFPQIALSTSGVVVAWTDVSDAGTQVLTKLVPLQSIN